MAKSLEIKVVVDRSAARRAERETAQQLQREVNGAKKAYADQTNGHAKAAQARVANTRKQVDQEERLITAWAARDYRMRVAIEERKQRLAERTAERQQKAADLAAKAAQRDADRKVREAERTAARQQKIDDREAARKQKDADREAARQQKAADRETARKQRDADREAARQQKAADREAARKQKDADREAARQQKAADREAARKQREADRIAAIESRYSARDYRARVAAEERKQRLADKTAAKAQKAADARVDAALKASRAEIDGADGASQAISAQIGKVGNLVAAYIGIRAAVAAYKAATQAIEAAKSAAEEYAKETIRTRDVLQEIANIKGKIGVDNEELAKFIDLRKASGLTHQEAEDFVTETLNAVGTVSEEKISNKERERLVHKGAQLTARLGGGAEGARARGVIMGLLPEFIEGNDVKAERVVATADKADQILQKGAGSNKLLTTQYQNVLTTLTSAGLQGQFINNPLKAAGLTAIASKFGPQSAATSTLEAVREVSAINKFRQGDHDLAAQAETLQNAGVTEFMNPEQRLTKLFEYMDREGAGTKEAPSAFLKRRGFRNNEGAESLAKFYEQYKAGNFQRIMAEADEAVDPAAVDKKFNEYAASLRGQNRLADARIDAAKVDRGKREEPLEIARKHGEARIIEEGLNESPGFQLGQQLHGYVVGKEQAERIAKEQIGLGEQARALGVTPRAADPMNVLFGVDSRDGVNQQQARALQIEAQAQRMRGEAGFAPRPPAVPAGPMAQPPAFAPGPAGVGPQAALGPGNPEQRQADDRAEQHLASIERLLSDQNRMFRGGGVQGPLPPPPQARAGAMRA
jgi:hypothetical protein